MAERGRPRRPGADEAILAATRALLFEHGFAGFSMDDVARHAGVGRQSVYRRWPSKSTLAIASVIWSVDVDNAFPDLGSFEADLRGALEMLRELYTASSAAVFVDVHAAMVGDPAARGSFEEHYLQPRRDSLRRAVERGIARGDLCESTDLAIVGDLVCGPFLHRLLTGSSGFSDELIDAIVASVLGLYGVPPGAR